MPISVKELRTLAEIIKGAVNTEDAKITVLIGKNYENTEMVEVYVEYDNGLTCMTKCPTV